MNTAAPFPHISPDPISPTRRRFILLSGMLTVTLYFMTILVVTSIMLQIRDTKGGRVSVSTIGALSVSLSCHCSALIFSCSFLRVPCSLRREFPARSRIPRIGEFSLLTAYFGLETRSQMTACPTSAQVSLLIKNIIMHNFCVSE